MHSEHATDNELKRLDLAPIVAQIVDRMNPGEMLCYGGPDGVSPFWLNFSSQYTVSIETYTDSIIGAARPQPSTLVVCADYLHSVGMLRIHEVLDELCTLTRGIGFFHVRTQHELEELRTIDKPILWWLTEFTKRFELQTFQRLPDGFYVIVSRKAH